MSSQDNFIYCFGLFEFDLRAAELRKNGVKVKLHNQPYQVLLKLLQNPGEIISREELRSTLWQEDTFVDFETGLNAAVRRLREALGDSADNPIFIETLPRRGYRFIAPVERRVSQDRAIPVEKSPEQRFQPASDPAFALEALSAITPSSAAHAVESKRGNRLAIAIVGAAVVIMLGISELTYIWIQPAAVPTVSNYVQLTHDGQPKTLVGTDGSRLYLSLSGSESQGVTEMSISGGEWRKIPTLLPADMIRVVMSPDGSELLYVDGQGLPPKGPLWTVPVLGGSPRRLGEIEALDAAWSPDGKMVAYCNDNELFVARADGSESRKVVTMKNPILILGPVWSPDGTHLRLTTQQSITSPSVFWEVSVNGTELHRLLPGWTNPPDSECCGNWTADGKYFVFQSRKQIWALPRKNTFLRSNPKPIPLTSSPLLLSSAIPSKDGKKLFVVGQTDRGELTRYDLKSGQRTPFLGGISAEYVAFSKDGQRVAYVLFPEGTLWRSKADGGERLQLTYPPNYAMLPRWSPDGKTIVFFETFPDKLSKIYEISAEGGSPRQLMPDDTHSQADPNWSPDGSQLVFGSNGNDVTLDIRILDLTTRQVAILPGSQGLYSPRWSPDGRYIPAFSADSTRLLLFDRQNHKWTELAKGTFGWLNWSKEGQYLEVLDYASPIAAVLKIRISDGRTERVVDLKNFIRAGRFGDSLAIAPDDSPLLLRNAGTQDVYALDWKTP